MQYSWTLPTEHRGVSSTSAGIYTCALSPVSTTRVDGPSTRLVEMRTRQHGPCWGVMETGHPSARAVSSSSGNRALLCMQVYHIESSGAVWCLQLQQLYLTLALVLLLDECNDWKRAVTKTYPVLHTCTSWNSLEIFGVKTSINQITCTITVSKHWLPCVNILPKIIALEWSCCATMLLINVSHHSSLSYTVGYLSCRNYIALVFGLKRL